MLLLLVCLSGGVWAAASAAWRAQLVRRLQGASGGAGLRGAAAIVEVHSRTLACVDAAAYDALAAHTQSLTEMLAVTRTFLGIRPVSRLLR